MSTAAHEFHSLFTADQIESRQEYDWLEFTKVFIGGKPKWALNAMVEAGDNCVVISSDGDTFIGEVIDTDRSQSIVWVGLS